MDDPRKTPPSEIPPNVLFVKSDSICNICGKERTLSKEHTPPEGCLRRDNLALEVRPRLRPSAHPRFSQSGIRHVSTCVPCNNGMGRDGDDGLKIFCENVAKFWRTSGQRSRRPRRGESEPTVLCNTRKVLRSVYGHALAANEYTPRGQFYDKMRDFVLGRFRMPEDLSSLPSVYYFIHQDNCVYIDQSTLYHIGGKMTPLIAMKWYPVAFIVSPRRNLATWDEGFHLPCLNDLLTSGDIENPVPIFARPAFWYECLTEGQGVQMTSSYSKTSVDGRPRRPIRE